MLEAMVSGAFTAQFHREGEYMPIRVLSAGAPKTAVSRCAEAFESATGQSVEVTFATAPVLRERVEQGTAEADVVVAPVPGMDGFEQAGQVVPGKRVVIGAVRAGVVVRDGAPEPDISTANSLKAAILMADSIVYNKASSGQYIARMMENFGLTDAIRDKITLVANGAAVMKFLAESRAGNEIGFGQIT
jgi:molybdate transport system substrate-binding protein